MKHEIRQYTRFFDEMMMALGYSDEELMALPHLLMKGYQSGSNYQLGAQRVMDIMERLQGRLPDDDGDIIDDPSLQSTCRKCGHKLPKRKHARCKARHGEYLY